MTIHLSGDTRLRLFGPLFLFAFGTFFFRFSVYTTNSPHKVVLYTYIETTGIQVVYVCVHVAVYEGQYLIQQLQKTTSEKEQLMKAEWQWQARFDSLKSQVNPHFLFNALNALSTLIDESPAQAGQFVDELSKVYRYLLQSNDRELTSLYTELRFIQSYAHLLRT